MTPSPNKSQDGNESIPPELKPYYGPGESLTKRRLFWLGRILLVVVVIVVLFVLGSIWLHSHKVGEKPANSKNSTSQQAGSPGQGAKPTEPSTNQPTKPNGNQSSEPATGSTGGTTTEGTPESGSATTSNIPNTGPGTSVIILAAAIGLAGALLNYVRQLHIARRSGQNQ